MTANDDQFHMTIEDNGLGFNPNIIADKPGMGIQNIRSRVNYLNGELDLMSQLEKGTSYDIVFPIA